MGKCKRELISWLSGWLRKRGVDQLVEWLVEKKGLVVD